MNIFSRLRRRQLHLLTRAFLLLTMVRLGLACLSFQRLQLVLARFSDVQDFYKCYPIPPDKVLLMSEQIAWAVHKSAQLMPGGAKCLAKALVTQVLMARRSLPCEFKIGVAKANQGVLEAHAWIEFEGKIIMGNLPDLDRYQSLSAR